jgi:hypothetical protein
MGRDKGGKGDLLFLNCLQQILWIETDHIVDENPCAAISIGKRIIDRIDMAHRHDEHHTIIGLDARIHRIENVLGKIVFLGSDNPL